MKHLQEKQQIEQVMEQDRESQSLGSSSTSFMCPCTSSPSSSVSSSSSPSRSQSRNPNLKLDIPKRTPLDYITDFSKPPPQSPGSGKSKRFILNLPRPPSSNKLRASVSPKQPQSTCSLSSSGSSSYTNMLNPLPGRRTSSLPVTPVNNSVIISICGEDQDQARMSEKLLSQQPKMERSLSAPLKKTRSLRPVMLVKSVSPKGQETRDVVASTTGEEKSQEIPLEQAVCRICMDELGEDSKTLKTECSCKGELALAHEDCAIKWFVIKGNRMCDICGEEVRNLPVTLTRLSGDPYTGQQVQVARHAAMMGAILHDVPVLVLISMLVYFCLLEELLVRKLGSGALAIALPFACVLGILTTIAASTLVARKYIWGYAVLQFVMVAGCTQILYHILHMEPILAILLSGFAGIAIAMTVNGICLEYVSWRRDQNPPEQNQPQNMHPQNQQANVELQSLSSPV